MSAPSSGGVCSSAFLTAETIWLSGSVRASRISLDEMVKLRGSDRGVSLADIARGVAGLPGYYIPGGVSPGLASTEHVIINDMTYANGSACAEVEIACGIGKRFTCFTVG